MRILYTFRTEDPELAARIHVLGIVPEESIIPREELFDSRYPVGSVRTVVIEEIITNYDEFTGSLAGEPTDGDWHVSLSDYYAASDYSVGQTVTIRVRGYMRRDDTRNPSDPIVWLYPDYELVES